MADWRDRGRALLNLILNMCVAWRWNGKLDGKALSAADAAARKYDKKGTIAHYTLISALHKSRSGLLDPDAAL